MSQSKGIMYPPETKAKRRQDRKNMDDCENAIWGAIRKKQLGPKLRRKAGIGPYIVDFYAASLKLAIDVHLADVPGEWSSGSIDKQAFLKAHGIDLVRITRTDVLNDGGIDRIIQEIAKRGVSKLSANVAEMPKYR